MRSAIRKLNRYIVTPRVAKHRIFVWLDANVIPDGRLNVFVRDDDYFFGVLQSRLHELWALRFAARHGVGNDPTYNNRICFETYPFPWPPGQEPQDDPRVQAIAEAARDLVAQRDAWLNPPGLEEKELAKRTLTNLYNQRPEWLDAAHKRLDAAVLAAYGWPGEITDEEILARLLALNLERAGKQ
jgi:type II restriction/modification system DNA methylase subunit YeeA